MGAEELDNDQLMTSLERLDTLDGYRRHFADAGYWRLPVQEACRRHLQTPCRTIRSGVPGTCPTFIVDDRWVVKFFGRLFDGALAYETEREVSRLLSSERVVPTPALVACGQLLEGTSGWPWPYLIFECVPGFTIGEVYERLSFQDRLMLARNLGAMTRRLHELPVTSSVVFQPTWDAYVNLLREQRAHCQDTHRAWGTLPERMIDQIDTFLLPLEALVDCNAAPHLIHADLTRDHVLGRLNGGGWTTLGIIDFGDAMVGNVLYELIALHLDLFQCDKRLLSAYLDAYGLDEQFRRSLPAKAMSVALLHRFNVLEGIFDLCVRAHQIATLDQLAALLWDVDAPGLSNWMASRVRCANTGGSEKCTNIA